MKHIHTSECNWMAMESMNLWGPICSYAVTESLQHVTSLLGTQMHIQLELMVRQCERPCTRNMLHSVTTTQECNATSLNRDKLYSCVVKN